MICIGRFFPDIYKTESIIKEMAKEFIYISALVMPLCAFSHGAYFTLRSGGKTVITFIFDSLYVWVVLIPVTYFLSRHTTLSIITVFFLVQFTEIVKVIIGYFMIKSGIWINNIVS